MDFRWAFLVDRNGLRFADQGKARNAHLSEIELKGNEAWLKSQRCAMEKEILQPRSRTEDLELDFGTG